MGVFVTPEPVMQIRAVKLQEQMGWDSEQLKQKLSAWPNILNFEPSTLARNVQDLQGVGFSQTQVWAMCTKQPALLSSKWTSDISIEKVQFVKLLLGLSFDDIAARPKLLTYSVSSMLGPRVWFLYQIGAIGAPNTVMTSGLFGYITLSKKKFGDRFRAPIAFPSMIFDSAFSDHQKQRWEYLRQHMKLSVETIAAHQNLLLISLPDRLAPRWQLLSRIASEQADFKAEDHLTALATLSDQYFADVFDAGGKLHRSHLDFAVSCCFYSCREVWFLCLCLHRSSVDMGYLVVKSIFWGEHIVNDVSCNVFEAPRLNIIMHTVSFTFDLMCPCFYGNMSNSATLLDTLYQNSANIDWHLCSCLALQGLQGVAVRHEGG